MEKKIFRFLVVFSLAVAQISLFAPITGGKSNVSLALMVVVAWTIVAGFEEVWKWVLLLGFLIDLSFFDAVGTNIMIFILVSYFVSFFSRRFMVENKGWGTVMMIFFAAAAIMFYDFAALIVMRRFEAGFLREYFDKDFSRYVFKYLYGEVLFFAVYWFISKIENYISFYDKKIHLKIK